MSRIAVNGAERCGAVAAGEVAGVIRELAAGVLGVAPESVDVRRPLRELGMDSTQVMDLAAELSRRLERAVPARVGCQHPSVAALSAFLTGGDSSAFTDQGSAGAGDAGSRGVAEPVAVIGMGCRLPGGADVFEVLGEGLRGRAGEAGGPFWEGAGAGTPGGLVADSARNALAHARVAVVDLADARVGVFVGAGPATASPVPGAGAAGGAGPYSGTPGAPDVPQSPQPPQSPQSPDGSVRAVRAVRLADALGIPRPALSVAAGCGSSLAAVDLAVRSLRDGSCGIALAGGAAGLPPDGPVTGGHGRAVGGVLVLRRISDALAAGDRIHAVIHGSAVDGRTAPPRGRPDPARAAWRTAGVAPPGVACLDVPDTGRPDAAERAPGVIGLLRAVVGLCLGGPVPGRSPALSPSPAGAGAAGASAVPGGRWPGGRRYVGVRGHGGTLSHVALEAAAPRRRLVVPVAATGDAALRRSVREHLARWDAGEAPDAALAVPGTGAHRVAAAGEGPGEVRDGLLAGLEDRTPPPAGGRPALAFLFSGGGPQWIGTGRALLAEPAFRATLAECDRAVRAVTGWSVIEELLADDGQSLVRTDVLQPVLFSVQTALARTLRAWGVESDIVLGASIGEAAAAVAAGALSLEEGARLIATWSALVAERASGHGTLTVCDLPLAEAERFSARSGGRVFVASHLAPGQVCLSGTVDDMAAAERELAGRGVATLRTPVDYAGHSTLLADIAPELVRRLGTLDTRRTRVPYWSTVTHGFVDGTALDASYWVRNMCEPTLMEEAVHRLAGERAVRIVEISPHPVALFSVRQTLAARGDTRSAALATGHRDVPARQGLEDLVARLWCDGIDVDWSAAGAAAPAARGTGAALPRPRAAAPGPA
ncbi:acyltransferase domain-containing protein [Streptomyces sp. NPDC059892]|uniref:acyltransferase domain-containing protein n=1 Tax=Streptomyces sp. NPDC059892 TaxID=3346989 RepID=UPI0036473681